MLSKFCAYQLNEIGPRSTNTGKKAANMNGLSRAQFHEATLLQTLLLNNLLLSRKEQDTSHRLYTLSGNLKMLLCLATFFVLK